MENVIYLLQGFETALSGWNLLYCFIGVVFGMLVGVLPGIGPTAGTALLLPLTFAMEPVSAIIMLAGIYYGAMYGGTITSVLINTPGEAASVITCLDGYPLAQQGRAGAALGVAGIGSFIGGLITILALAFLGPPLAKIALNFGPPEFFALILLGMTLLSSLMGKSLIRGIMAAVFGLILALVGPDPLTGTIRFAFGQTNLAGGIDIVALCLGLFGMSELFISAETNINGQKPMKVKGVLPKREEWKPTFKAIGRGTGIGGVLGFIPGSGTVIPTLLSYSLEKKLAKDPSRFGKGALEGVAGPEAANNAYCGSALIPLFTLGIPGSAVMAILFGAFVMHGLTPGPLLFQNEPNVVWGVIASMFIGNFLLVLMNVPLAGVWAKITTVPFKLLFPIIMIVAVVGVYSVNNSLFDVGTMMVFGFIGYFFKKAEFPLAPIILTFVLGSFLETSLGQSLTIFDGNFFAFFTRPISGTVLVFCILVIGLSAYAGLKNKKSVMEDSEM
ncbi:transporter [Virgibacillus profundi]|uniref:Transporter n=1 Tax=Virgibacillus profundi TaxID=2024555 RepID=A0A2A2IAP7_9BACI|nr:tripartite tricarboxylate transporter permease [Virgibacillus profundi]PAV28396.1 transporter [Virgibacillus profundi]PXY52242.1 transporter [Virgibacillus profundi]